MKHVVGKIAALGCAWLLTGTSALADSHSVYALAVGPERLVLLDLESRRDGPDRPTVTMIVISAVPTVINGRSAQRIDMSVQFDCGHHTAKILDLTSRTLDGTFLLRTDGRDPAAPILPGTPSGAAEPIVCRNEISPDIEGLVGSLESHQRAYFDTLRETGQ